MHGQGCVLQANLIHGLIRGPRLNRESFFYEISADFLALVKLGGV